MLVWYWWTDDGEKELCKKTQCILDEDKECYHCGTKLSKGTTVNVLTTLNDNEKYIMCIVCTDKNTINNNNGIKIWLDDLRSAPEGYTLIKSVNDAKAFIEQVKASGETIELLDLDHDLGDYAEFGGDAINLLDYLVENELFYPVKFHTANPVGRANMERIVNRFWPK